MDFEREFDRENLDRKPAQKSRRIKGRNFSQNCLFLPNSFDKTGKYKIEEPIHETFEEDEQTQFSDPNFAERDPLKTNEQLSNYDAGSSVHKNERSREETKYMPLEHRSNTAGLILDLMAYPDAERVARKRTASMSVGEEADHRAFMNEPPLSPVQLVVRKNTMQPDLVSPRDAYENVNAPQLPFAKHGGIEQGATHDLPPNIKQIAEKPRLLSKKTSESYLASKNSIESAMGGASKEQILINEDLDFDQLLYMKLPNPLILANCEDAKFDELRPDTPVLHGTQRRDTPSLSPTRKKLV